MTTSDVQRTSSDATEAHLAPEAVGGVPATPGQVLASSTSEPSLSKRSSHADHDATTVQGSYTPSEKGPDDTRDVAAKTPEVDDDMQGPEELSRKRFTPVFFGLLMGIFIVSLDNTVVATSQIAIVRELGGENLLPWLPTTFLIGQAAFSLFWGQVLTTFPSKYIYMFNVFFFEVGSLVSALAPTMGCVLAGRTVAGVAASGIFMSALQILAETTSIATRAFYMGFMGMLFTLSMIVGPIIGGALASVTWRWVFYINLPIGGVALIPALFLLPVRPALGTSKSNPPPFWSSLVKLDIVGTVLMTGFMCMIILPIQEAQHNGWASAATWAPICLSLVVAALFGFWLWYAGEQRAVLPVRLFKDLNFIGCSICTFCTFWNAIVFIYFIPYLFQIVRGHTATKSGVDMLALMITVSIASVVSGALTRKFGLYYPQLQFAPLLGMVGAGLMYLTPVNGDLGLQIGSQILVGLGIGPVIQSPILVVQANTADRRLLAKATGMVAFSQRLGGGIGSSVAGAVLAAQLPVKIRSYLPPGVDAAPYIKMPATQYYSLPAGPIRDGLLAAVTRVITDVFLIGIPFFFFVALAVICFIPIRNITTKKVLKKQDALRMVACLPRRTKTEEIDA